MPKSRTPLQPPKQRPRSASRYKRSETTRLVKGAMDAGLTVRGLEADLVTGKITVLVGKPGEPSDKQQFLGRGSEC
jgi:hypothetical protein